MKKLFFLLIFFSMTHISSSGQTETATFGGGCFWCTEAIFRSLKGVETVESYRGHGYPGAAVAKSADIIRLQGVIPLYSTSWKNRISQSVAGKLQMIRYAEDWSIA